MPIFWEAIKAVNGANTLGVIRLNGKLELERDSDNPQGKVWIQATERLGSNPGYDLSIVANNAANSDEIKEVYWLPWKNRSVEHVLVTDLNGSNCDYFLTSMLTGCRFVETDTMVAHVSNEQGTAFSPRTDQSGRDHVETTLLDSAQATTRRKLSVSAADKPGINWSGADTIHSYQRNGKEGAGSAFVIGYKDSGTWTYKWLMHADGANSPNGSWSTMG